MMMTRNLRAYLLIPLICLTIFLFAKNFFIATEVILNIDSTKIAYSYLILICISTLSIFVLIIRYIDGPIFILGTVLLWTIIFPIGLMLCLDSNPHKLELENYVTIIISFFSILVVAIIVSKIVFIKIALNTNQFYFLIIFANLIGLFIYLSTFNGSLSLDWGSIYDRRLAAREVTGSSPFLAYYGSFYAGFLIPMSAAWGFDRGKYFLVLLALTGSILLFMAFGGKGVLFSSILAILIVAMYKKIGSIARVFCYGLFVVFLLTFLEFVFFDTLFLNSFLFRRMFVVPAQLTGYWFDYFDITNFYFMSDGIFGNGDVVAKARIIGLEYFGRIETNANANIWASVYGDFGLAGVLGISIFVGGFFGILNSCYKKSDRIMVISFAFFAALVFSQGSFFTAMLSNGLFFGLLLMLILPKVRV